MRVNRRRLKIAHARRHRIVQDRNEDIIREFRRRSTRPLVMLFLLIVCALVHVIRRQLGYPPSVALLIIGLGLGFWALLFSLVSWRCPSCDRYLGQGFQHAMCPSCGIPLR